MPTSQTFPRGQSFSCREAAELRQLQSVECHIAASRDEIDRLKLIATAASLCPDTDKPATENSDDHTPIKLRASFWLIETAEKDHSCRGAERSQQRGDANPSAQYLRRLGVYMSRLTQGEFTRY